MKKLFLIVFTFVIYSVTCAQFVITPNGYKSEKGEDYIVYEFPAKAKVELFKAVSTNILKTMSGSLPAYYSNSEDFIVMTNVVRKFVNKGICALTVEYILRFAIEEGRVLVYAPEVNFHGTANGAEILLFPCAGKNWAGQHFYIYSKEGKLQEKEIKDQIEAYFNKEMTDLIGSIK